ncbi:MAG: hypothetical protein WDZ88_03170 [Candidatus Paceibacterota bacterium]
MTTKQQWIALTGLCIILIVLYISTQGRGGDIDTLPDEAVYSTTTEEVEGSATTGEQEGTVVQTDVGDVTLEGNGTVEVLEVEDYPKPVPSLTVELVFPDFYTAEARVEQEEKIEILRSDLRDNPSDFTNWLELGNYYTALQMYVRAEEALVYANKLAPKNSLGYRNLGVLYAYYLKNNQKAEIAFKQSIENDPQEGSSYFALFEFYRDVLNDSEKARNILVEGVEMAPKDTVLKATLDAYVQ